MQTKRALVVFGSTFPRIAGPFEVVVADKRFKQQADALGAFVDVATLIGQESIYEAGAMLEQLGRVALDDGTPMQKSVSYKGYELWWMHYTPLFRHFCLPYSQYKKLLEYLSGFNEVYCVNPPYRSLFSAYFEAHGTSYTAEGPRRRVLPIGVALQMFLTLLSVPVLLVMQRRTMIFIGDKFAAGKDYDFRMGFIYEGVHRKNIPYMEIIRSLEPWSIVLKNFFVRGRPVIYSEAIGYLARFISAITGESRRWRRALREGSAKKRTPEERFLLLVAAHYVFAAGEDIWAIRITAWLLRVIGIHAGLFTAISDRNFYAGIGCKLNGIPTAGILHGVASRYGTPYDYLNGFSGEKSLTVDAYGVWSQWWKEHFIKESDAYRPEQLVVSGPMRPLVSHDDAPLFPTERPRVLFIAEQTAYAPEVMPYLRALKESPDIELTVKFRPFRDGFEEWLRAHEPQFLAQLRSIKGGMEETIKGADVVVGCHSTGVLEALLQLRMPIFLNTHKWGDYYGMASSSERARLFAKDPKELLERISGARSIPKELLATLRQQYFGDPHKNGSEWVVERIETLLSEQRKA